MPGSRWLLVLVLLTRPFGLAHDLITTKLTYARDVQPIFSRRCVACHSAATSIPLTNYQQVRPWAVDIKEQVLSRAMPPWGAVKGFRALDPDNALTEDELTIIAAWVVGGTPEGDSSRLVSQTPAKQISPPVAFTEFPVQTRATLPTSANVIGIRPLSSGVVLSAKITARLPDGRIEPLLWLACYDSASKRAFHFHAPLLLPAGTTIASTIPLAFALQTAKASLPAR